jgi:hypothetical protein
VGVLEVLQEAAAALFQVEDLVVLVEVEETMVPTPPQEELETLHQYHPHKEIMEVIIHHSQIQDMQLVVVEQEQQVVVAPLLVPE